MTVIYSGLFMIKQRFPSSGGRLHQLYVNNQSFRSLCHDYRKCTEALSHWTTSNHDHAQERSREYEELITSLEQEIEYFLIDEVIPQISG